MVKKCMFVELLDQHRLTFLMKIFSMTEKLLKKSRKKENSI